MVDSLPSRLGRGLAWLILCPLPEGEGGPQGPGEGSTDMDLRTLLLYFLRVH